jgi:hypothetical protein
MYVMHVITVFVIIFTSEMHRNHELEIVSSLTFEINITNETPDENETKIIFIVLEIAKAVSAIFTLFNLATFGLQTWNLTY